MNKQAQPGAVQLKLDGVYAGYGEVSVVRDLSFEVQGGEIFALMGKNGMGKTTLLKTIVGLIPTTKGSVHFNGTDITHSEPKTLIEGGVRYAPQDQPLFQDMSIRDNLRLALASDKELDLALQRVFEYFPFLSERLKQAAGTLSGGEQKMLIIARALMTSPKLLLIDEISEGLQPTVIARIAAALKAERDTNRTAILIVEQNLDFALSIANRWAMLKIGEIVDSGDVGPTTKEVVHDHFKI